jgi:type III pantothenate kinase
VTRTLLVDVGNTRVKWATCEDGQLSEQRAVDRARGTAVDDDDAAWAEALFADAGAGGIARVAAVTVAGAASERRLRAAAARHGVADVRFHVSTAQACGVVNGYRDPALLGVDRWAAVIGAHHRYAPRACCVVDVGTAATVDAVTGDGRHLGGFIVPGPRMMVRALHLGTSDLATRSAASTAGERPLFADNTRDAIERGSRVTLAALVDRAVAELAHRAAGPATLVVTGGAAAEIAPYVLAPLEFVPDLVLYGVSRLAWNGS